MNSTQKEQRELSDEELQRLMKEYIPLVKSLAKKYEGRGAEFDDLVQEGYLAILKLAPKCRKREYMALFLKKRLPAKVRNAAKRLRRKYSVETELPEGVFDPKDERQNVFPILSRLIDGLEKDDYRLLKMVAFGYLQKEIAEKLGITQQAVSSRVGKVRKKAKTLLD